MKKNKGFTLIELLAVIIILAIIALIATPIVLNIIEDARVNTFKASGNGLLRAVEIYIQEENLDEGNIIYDNNEFFIYKESLTKKFTKEILDISFKGTKPDRAIISFNSDNKRSFKMTKDELCTYIDETNQMKAITKKRNKELWETNCIIDTNEPIPNFVNITFKSNNDSFDEITKEVSANSLITDVPVFNKENYLFIGWYTDEDLSIDWIFDNDKTGTSDMTLYGKWKNNKTYAVSFDLAGGTSTNPETYQTQHILAGNLVTRPINPKRARYAFVEWRYLGDGGTSERWDFNMPIYKDVELIAIWR